MKHPFQGRFLWLIALLIVAALWVYLNLCRVSIGRRPELNRDSSKYTRTTLVSEAWRGQIRDRNGLAVAISAPAVWIYTDLHVWSNRIDSLAQVVAPLLGTSERELALRVRPALMWSALKGERDQAHVLLLKPRVPLDQWDGIKAALTNENFGFAPNRLTRADQKALKTLRARVLIPREESVRQYPFGSALAQVIGFVGQGTNGYWLEGRTGIERSFDAQLRGVNGKCESEHDAAGNELPQRRTSLVTAIDGYNVTLTIDMRVQLIVEKLLDAQFNHYAPSNASVIVVEPKTGAILALACRPAFSPEHLKPSDLDAWRNHAISDMVEPGSVMKTFLLAAALDLGVLNLDQLIDCGNNRFVYKTAVIHGHNSRGWLTVRKAFAISANPAFAQIGLMVGPERFYHYVREFGFGAYSRVELPGELPGMLNGFGQGPVERLPYIAIGQGISVTQLQLVMAMSAIANDGLLMRPRVIEKVEDARGRLLARVPPQPLRRVIRPQTAWLVREALKGVVSSGGTAPRAALTSYVVCGKTGTAQIASEGRYLPDVYLSSFTGFLPADRPELCISVVFDAVNKQRPHAGGTVAGPLFHDIGEALAELFHIPPDKARPRWEDRSSQQTTVALRDSGFVPPL